MKLKVEKVFADTFFFLEKLYVFALSLYFGRKSAYICCFKMGQLEIIVCLVSPTFGSSGHVRLLLLDRKVLMSKFLLKCGLVGR